MLVHASRPSRPRRGVAAALTATLGVALSMFGAAAPAHASVGGTAEAQAADVSLAAAVALPGTDVAVSLQEATPLVSAPSTADTASNGAGLSASGVGASATVDVTSVSATRAVDDVSAAADVAGSTVSVGGVEVLSTGAVSATVTCPVNGAPSAAAEVAGFRIGGVAYTVAANATVDGA